MTRLASTGFGGQYIFVFRELGLVVAVTSSTASDEERRGYREQLFDLIESHVLRTAQRPDSSPDPS